MSRLESTIWIVCPIYKDASAFHSLYAEVIASIRAVISWRFYHIKFVLLDDSAGRDKEIEALTKLKGVRVIAPPHRLGQQGAIVAALRVLSLECHEQDFVVTMDADGEDRPEDVGKMLDRLRGEARDNAAVVIGRRSDRKRIGETLGFSILRRSYQLLFRVLTGRNLSSGNFAAFRGWTVKNILVHQVFELAYSTALLRLIPRPIFFDCPRGRRLEGKSRLSWRSRFALAFQLLTPYRERVTLRLQAVKIFAFSTAIAGIMLGPPFSTPLAVFGIGWILLSFTIHTALTALTESIRSDLGPKIELTVLESICPPTDEQGAEIFSRASFPNYIRTPDHSTAFE